MMSTHNINLLDTFPGTVYRCKDGNITKLTDNKSKEELAKDIEPVTGDVIAEADDTQRFYDNGTSDDE